MENENKNKYFSNIYIYIQMSKKLLQKIVLNTKVEHYIKQKE